jgi:hypothetical protein
MNLHQHEALLERGQGIVEQFQVRRSLLLVVEQRSCLMAREQIVP